MIKMTCGYQRRRQDRPGLSERLFQCADRMCVVLDGITQGSSMEVRQPVDERGSENGKNELRFFQMPGRGCDDRRGHDRAGDDAFAVDQSQRVALRLHSASARWLFGGHFLAKSTQAPMRQGILRGSALEGGFPVKPVGQRPLSDFCEALLQLGTGSNESLDDGDVIATGQRPIPERGDSGRAGQQRLLAGESGTAPSEPQHAVPRGTCQPACTVAAMGLRPNPGDALSPPLLVRGERLVDRQAAECLRNTSASSTASATPWDIEGDIA